MINRLKWLLPAITLLLALILLSLSGGKPNHGSKLGKAVLEIVGPLENLLTSSARGVESVWRRYFRLIDLSDENRRLHEMVDRQNRQIVTMNEYKLANDRLTKLLDFNHLHPHMTLQPALVVAWDPGPWFRSVIINAGSSSGVAIDQAVVHPQGVVGRVVEVTPHYARVLLATDFNSSIDSFVQRSRVSGIVSGLGSQPAYSVNYIRKDEDVRTGDQIITSGLDGLFPKGLPLGTVNRVNRKSVDIFVDIEVTPSVDFDSLEEVLVVIQERPPIDWLGMGPALRPLLKDEIKSSEPPSGLAGGR